MAALVLLALAIVEIVMLVLSVRKRSSSQQWIRARTAVSVGEVLVLGVLMALPFSGIAFDFRWMALFVVLALRAVIAVAVYLARSKKASAYVPHRAPRMVLNAIGSIVVVAIAAVPALLFPAYSGLPTTGEFDVCESNAIMVDASRTDPFEQDGSSCEVPVWFYYPDAPDAQAHEYPLVVFSHGAFGYHASNYSLYAELASHGYVVASVDYPHHSFFTNDTQGQTVIVDQEFITQAVAVQNGDMTEDESYALSEEWMRYRVDDLGFALDTIEAAALGGSLDGEAWFFDSDDQKGGVQEALRLASIEKIGLVGHSMGGATSVGVGRVRSEVGAVVDLDGTMFTEYSYSDGTYTFIEDPYPVPLLSVDNEDHYASGQETGPNGEPYVNTYVLENATVSAHTYAAGSGHMNFTDLPLFSPTLASMLGTGSVDAQTCVEQTNALVLAWFDEYLKGQGSASIPESF